MENNMKYVNLAPQRIDEWACKDLRTHIVFLMFVNKKEHTISKELDTR